MSLFLKFYTYFQIGIRTKGKCYATDVLKCTYKLFCLGQTYHDIHSDLTENQGKK